MLVDLKLLRPNPRRDFIVDPIDEDRIEMLRKSIAGDGFWGGVVCRQVKDGTVEIAAGHSRVAAAIAAGLTQADVFVMTSGADDATMIRIYAKENATQRANLGTAQVGSVASALKYIAESVISGVRCQEFLTPDEFIQTKAAITCDKGIGQRSIIKVLRDTPGINDGTVQQALANLKASGDYARIITEVHAKIERENVEALKALEEAERERERIKREKEAAEKKQKEAEAARKEAAAQAKAAKEEAEKKQKAEALRQAQIAAKRAEEEKKLAKERDTKAAEEMKKHEALQKTRDTAEAAKKAATTETVKDAEGKTTGHKPRTITFDHTGVAKHLKNPSQVDAFRECVTGQGIAPFLPVASQAALAEHIVKLTLEPKPNGRRTELTAAFIREMVVTLVLEVKSNDRQTTKEEKEKLLRDDFTRKFKDTLHNFSRSCYGMAGYGTKINEMMMKWPKDLPIPITQEFRSSLESAKQVIDNLTERI